MALLVLPLAAMACDEDEDDNGATATAAPTEAALDEALARQLQAALDAAVEGPETPYPGAVFHVSSTQLGEWTGATGIGDTEAATATRMDDKFRAGSIVKPMVSVVVQQLAEEGTISLDDTLPGVLPEDVHSKIQDSDQITVRMLLNHTSGIPEWLTPQLEQEIASDPLRVWEPAEMLDLAAAQPPAFAPGAGWAYSNTDYTLLGEIIEEATGNSWRDEVTERVIDAAGLENTSVPEPGDPSLPENYMRGYVNVEGEMTDVSETDPSMAGAAGAAALVTTVSDITRFWKAVLAGELFENEATLNEMLTYVDAPAEGGQVGYGLGVERYMLPGGIELVGHLGGAPGYRSIMAYMPAQDMFIATAMNMQEDPTPVLVPLLEILVAQG
jgi:D-alanyl-D-alanine carboxypeptidase